MIVDIFSCHAKLGIFHYEHKKIKYAILDFCLKEENCGEQRPNFGKFIYLVLKNAQISWKNGQFCSLKR